MKRIKSLELRIMNLIATLFFLFFTLHSSLYTPALAVESTPSADIQQKLDDLKTAIASKAAKLKQEIHRKLENKAFVGEVLSKSGNSLTLRVKEASKNAVVSQDTIYGELGKPKSKFSFKTLDKGMRIATLGEIDDTGTLHAKKIVLLGVAKSEQQKAIIWGQIISEEDNLLVTQTKNKQVVPVSTLKIDTKFKLRDFAIVAGYKNKNDILEANFLHIIP